MEEEKTLEIKFLLPNIIEVNVFCLWIKIHLLTDGPGGPAGPTSPSFPGGPCKVKEKKKVKGQLNFLTGDR